MNTRTTFKHSTLAILTKIQLLNQYQNKLLKKITPKQSSIKKTDEEEIQEEI